MPGYISTSGEFVVNTTYARSQMNPDATRLANGNFIVTWTEARIGSSANQYIRAQIYQPDGTPVGGELVLYGPANGSGSPSIVGLASGGFMVTHLNASGGTVGQIFDSSGVASGPVFTVTTQFASDVNSVALAGGGFAVTWYDSRTTGGDTSSNGIHVMTYDQNGNPIGGDVLVNTTTSGNQFEPSITAMAGGGYVISWTDRSAGTWIVRGQFFDATGAKVGGELTFSTSGIDSSMTALANGNLAVSWYDASQHHVQIFSASGTPIGAQINVDTALSGTQAGPQIAALSTGGFVLTWVGDSGAFSDGSGTGIFFQAFDASSQPIGAPQLANSLLAGNQTQPSVTALDNGSFAINWTDFSVSGGDNDQIRGQIFTLDTSTPTAVTITSGGGGATAVVQAVENDTAVAFVTTHAPAGSPAVQYAITGGADAALFTINAATGLIRFVNSPNFEAPADANGDNLFDLVVTASDGTTSDSQAIAVQLLNMNDGPTITSGSTFTALENTLVAGTVAATDLEGDAISYSIVTDFTTIFNYTSDSNFYYDASRFSINYATGVISFVAAPNYEAPVDWNHDNVFQILVRATDADGVTSSLQAITITVGNVAEGTLITSNGGGATGSISMPENQSYVTTVVATDYAGPSVTYSISGGSDAARFTINSQTGVLSFVTAPNYEAPNDFGLNRVYDVIVAASDGTVTDTQALAITITNVNEAPVITSMGGGATAAVSLSESSTFVGSISATDPENNPRTYSIIGGADAARFTMVNGSLSFITGPNYEAPTDADGNNVYEVIVQASDGSLVDTQAISVTITNVNEAPVFATPATFSVQENTQTVGAVAASDPDGQTLTYSITGGVDAARFTINAQTGALTFVSSPNFEAPVDTGANNVYNITVGASDGAITTSQSLAITVTNVNEAPVITSNGAGDTATVTINENTSAVTTVTSTDPENTTRTYSIAGGTDAARFTINATTGALSFISAPDREAPTDSDGDNVYQVIVRASDGSLVDTQTINVTVANVNEAPTITSANSFAASENSTAAGTIAASDPDGTALTYSIVGGADAALFTINSATGALSFVSAPNYEAPADANSDNAYQVTVQASDGSLSATQAVTVTVGNVNEAPVITSDGAGASAALGIAENSTAVTTVTSSDPDGNPRTYSISGGADAALFTIDAATGVLSFVSAPNYEAPTDSDGNNVYQVTVSASDGSLVDTQTLAVTVNNVNEAPTIVSTANISASENSVAAGIVAAADPDGTALTYSIVGGADAALFTIDAATGALSFLSAPNYEAPQDADGDNAYQVTVQASDGSLSATQAVTVTVGDTNEGPSITSGSSFSAPENGTAVATLAASDPDGNTLTWSISGGADAALFTIDAATGALSFVSAPDHETPDDAGADNVYNVVVTASDGSLSASQTLSVAVTNVNETPAISSQASLSIAENTVAAGSVLASDPDGTALTYTIVGGTDAALFAINAATGALSFVSAPNYETPADANGDNAYEVTVQASDGSLSATQAVTVTVTNVNEGPAITSSGSFTVSENGSTVATLAGSDPDGTALTWSISGGADASLFTIDAATGALSFVTAPNYEAPTDAGANIVYDVVVTASDGSLSTSQAVSVAVTNVNEAPTIVSSASIAANENATAAGSVAATDPDGTALTYSIVGGADAALFTINSVTGALSFISAPNYEAPADADGNNAYQVTVQASDGSLSATQAVTVTVGNVNEGPSITSGSSYTRAENGTAVATLAASDPDGTALTWSISGGADAALFTIDAATGALSFVSAPNYEAPNDAGANNVYDVVVTASDGLLAASQAIAVAVSNANEGQIVASGQGATINENTTAAGSFSASDIDGDALSYAISGGADAALFTINAQTGAVSFISAPNYEAPGDADHDNVYNLVITASDGSISTSGSYTVTVGNVNEAPVITGSTVLAASENGTAVATLSSTDPEGNLRTWSISGGADALRFVIDGQTGALSFVTAPDYEAPNDSNGDNQYLVQVTVSDGSLSVSQLFTVNLGNVNEAPIITSNGGGVSASLTLAENTATVTTVTSTDPEGTARTYSIVGGADAARFTINAATGALTFVAAPNYEAPTDSNLDNIYNVIVAASDGLLTDTQALAITVTNVNEAPVITSNGGGDTAAITVNENTTAVTTLTSTDPEGTARTYSIVGGADAARFTINSATGALSFVSAPNWEAPTDSNGDNVYNVIVAASDGSLTDTQTLAVTVGNVVDGSTINGTNAANTLTGTTAEDTINGLGGNDTITGGLGADVLTGGTGADTFVYSSINDSSLSAPDRITDFTLSQNDRISLSGIDANIGLAGDQAFTWIGTGNFTNVAGQLRYYQSGGHTYVTGDVNGDGVGDFLIQLDPAVTLSASYFVL